MLTVSPVIFNGTHAEMASWPGMDTYNCTSYILAGPVTPHLALIIANHESHLLQQAVLHGISRYIHYSSLIVYLRRRANARTFFVWQQCGLKLTCVFTWKHWTVKLMTPDNLSIRLAGSSLLWGVECSKMPPSMIDHRSSTIHRPTQCYFSLLQLVSDH